MVVRTHRLLWSIAFVLFAGISVLMHPAIGWHGLSGQYFYKHSKLGFSLECSLPLTAREFPNGVELNNDAVQINDRIHIDVTNTTLEPDRYYVERIAQNFKKCRSAQAGAIFKGAEFGDGGIHEGCRSESSRLSGREGHLRISSAARHRIRT